MALFGYFIGMARTNYTSRLVRNTNLEATTQAQRVVAARRLDEVIVPLDIMLNPLRRMQHL